MHRCLEIAEIIGQICALVDDPSSLAALAVTCRGFSDSALDSLWKAHGDLVKLLKTMPDDLWEERGVRFGSSWLTQTALTLKRPIQESDWKRFFVYNRRIRMLEPFTALSRKKLPVCLDALQILVDNAPCDVIFPALRQLTIRSNMIEEAQLLRMFLNPNLEHFIISVDDNRILESLNDDTLVTVPVILGTVAQECPGLKSFIIRTSWEPRYLDSPVSVTVSDFICYYHNLEVLHLPRIVLNARGFHHIVSLPNLRELSWALDPFVDDDIKNCVSLPLVGGGSSSSSSLSALKNFAQGEPATSYDSMESFIFILSKFFPLRIQLEDLFVGITRRATAAPQLKRAVASMKDRLSHAHLKSVTFATMMDCDEDPDPYIPQYIALDDLRPLLCFTHLQSVSFSFYGRGTCYSPIRLDDEAVSAMASAWPFLEEFSIHSPSEEVASGVTWKGFLTLLNSCVELQIISLLVDFRSEGSTQIDEADFRVNNRMRWLSIHDSPLDDDVEYVSRLFRRIFPNLCGLSYASERPNLYSTRWKKVNNILGLEDYDI